MVGSGDAESLQVMDANNDMYALNIMFLHIFCGNKKGWSLIKVKLREAYFYSASFYYENLN